MHIGQNCKVRWETEQNSDVFIWHNAMIKSIEGDTITVIWEKGQWEGHESDRIPIHWVLVRDDMTSLRQEVSEVKTHVLKLKDDKKDFIKLFFSKLDGIQMRLDKMNEHLQRAFTMGTFCDDEVNYDISKLKSSLESLRSVHMYSSGSVNMEDSGGKNKKYFSTPELGDLYSKEKLHRYNNNH